jgi:hypothetical protein
MKDQVILSYTKGIVNTPSDVLSEDGMLDECVNLEVKSGELVPMEMPTRIGVSLQEGERLVLVHKTKSGVKTFVSIISGVLRFRDAETGSLYGFTLNVGTISSIQYIGNTIVVYSSDTPYYILYKNNDYKYIGSGIPSVQMSFRLNGTTIHSDDFKFKAPKYDLTTEEWDTEATAQLVPEANKLISEKATAQNKFIFPFLVRYAVRLYDGSYCRHSSPVLMLPSTKMGVYAFLKNSKIENGKVYDAVVASIASDLSANIESADNNMSDWSDLISGIDVFISKQIYNYDQNGTKGGKLIEDSYFIGRMPTDSKIIAWKINQVIINTISGLDQESVQIPVPSKDISEIYGEISSASLFYKFQSLKLEDVVNGNEIAIGGDAPLAGIEVMEPLKDDYMTNDKLIPKSSFVYNGRLNISNIMRYPFKGYPIQCLSTLCTDASIWYSKMLFGTYDVYVYIKSSDGGEDIVVKADTGKYGGIFCDYLFYPDTDAYQMLICESGGTKGFKVPLYPHPLLNGACGFTGFNDFTASYGDLSITAPNGKGESLKNKLYLSEVNNPFYFPLEGIYTVGSEEIIGMAAVTRPISQGQFGEFPLMVFCSDGNYAMRVDSQGYYSSISPMQEDIAIGSDKITSLEDSVVFVSKKGLMLSSGGDMIHVAPYMSGRHFDKDVLDKLDVSSHSYLVNATDDTEGFVSYLYGSRLVYDYASNRLIVYNPNKDYSYVYSFDNGVVSRMVIGDGLKIVSSAMDYPDVVLQDNKGGLYSVYEKEDVNSLSDHRYGFMLTKSLKMGDALVMKSIKQIKNIGTMSSDSYAKYMIYGSNDNCTWYRIMSRFGKPYKYYRLAIYTNMLPKETFIGTALTIEKRRTNKFR